jgi:uncharacterized protein YebE (UPF0316 family)
MLSSETLTVWVYLPLLIFVARTADMTLSTLRVAFIAQGRRVLAPLVGFVEALIWLVVISQALTHLSNPMCAIAYAGGFAAGNYAGLRLEERLAMGRRMVRFILPNRPADAAEEDVVAELRDEGFGVTVVHGDGRDGPVDILFTLARRADVPRLIEIVSRVHPKAFFSVADVRQASAETYPQVVRGGSGWLPWHVLGKSR